MDVTGNSITVMMPKIARKTLGLADGAFQRILIEANSIVFRGDGITRDVVLPVSMLGTFHSDILNSLFAYLHSNRQNGVLAITTGPLTKGIFFKRGHIVFSGSTDATERVGTYMQKMGMVTQEQIDEVTAHEDPRRFGVRLKAAGHITHEQLWEALRTQITSICCSLIDFPVGTYFFLPNCVPQEDFSHFFIEPSEVLFQGVIRMDERHHKMGYDPQQPDNRSPLEVLTSMEESD